MSVRISWFAAYVLAWVVCVIPRLSQSQDCSAEKMENATIDIKAAISKGIRGADPIHMPSWKACVNVCCLERRIAGSKPCNYVVFNTRRKGSSPNCYLFYYPIEETCPMKQLLGMVTYRLIRDTEVPEPTAFSIKVSHPVVKGSFLSPQTSSFYSAGTMHSLSGLLGKPTPFKRKETLDHVEKYSSKIEEHPNSGTVNGLQHLGSSPIHEINSLLLPPVANTVQHVIPIIQPTVKLPIVATGTHTTSDAGLHSHGSPSSAIATRSSAPYPGNSHQPTVNPSTTAILQSLTTSAFTNNNLVPLLSSAPTKSPSASLVDVHLSSRQPLEGYKANGGPATKEELNFGDKSILLAVLLFGVTLLVLITVLVGGKMLKSLQKRRYTRLDYLINGMYANM